MNARKSAAGLHLLVALALAGCGGDGGGIGPVDDPDGGGDDGGGGDRAEKPTELFDFREVGLYDRSSPLNAPIGENPPIDPDSDARVALLADAGQMVIQVRQYSAPVYTTDASTFRVDVELPCGETWELGVSRITRVPIPEYAEPADDLDGSDNPPIDCGEDADQDNHMVVLDMARRCEYDFWQARKEDGRWVASWGTATSMDSDGVYDGGLSTRGSGFAFLGGLIWPDELEEGRIEHKLAFSYPFTASGGPVAPATDSDGVTDHPDALPMGAVLQLDPDLDLDALGLDYHELVVARALQEYGMILVDTGGSSGIGLYAIDPRSVVGNPYANTLPDRDFVPLSNIPVESFRVLELPEQDGDWRERLGVPDNACAEYA